MLRCVLHESDLEKKTALWNVVKMCIDFGPAPKMCLGSKILLLVSTHSKRSHTCVQDLVVHVRVWWIMETLKITQPALKDLKRLVSLLERGE